MQLNTRENGYMRPLEMHTDTPLPEEFRFTHTSSNYIQLIKQRKGKELMESASKRERDFSCFPWAA